MRTRMAPLPQPHVAVRIGESFVLDRDRGHGRARADLAVNAPEDFPGRFEEERALDVHGREKIALDLNAIDHNKRLLDSSPMAAIKPVISAVGCYVPPGVLTNSDLEKMVQTNNEWIIDRTGISERHIAAPDVATSDLATCAAKAVLASRGIDASELDAILVCTVTPDMLFPSTACLVQHNLGASKAWGFDLVAACSGFVYGLVTGAKLHRRGHASQGAGDRRRHHEPHHRLSGPHHLRAFRRRRRGHADRTGRRERRAISGSSTSSARSTAPAALI